MITVLPKLQIWILLIFTLGVGPLRVLSKETQPPTPPEVDSLEKGAEIDQSAFEPGAPIELDESLKHAPELTEARRYLIDPPPTIEEEKYSEWRERIVMARKQRETGSLDLAFSNLQIVLDANIPDGIKKTALLEMAFTHQKAQNYPDALKSYGIFLKRYQDDANVPEVLLRQGLLYREIGAPQVALAKFHTVMTVALNLNMDEFDYYRGLVVMAQSQIAETYYQQGKLKEASEKYEILLRTEASLPNRNLIQYMLILCLSGMKDHPEVIGHAQDFLTHHPDEKEAPHIRYLLASSLKETGRNAESLSHVLTLLKSESANDSPNWRSWQQRTGNEIANQLYQDGDYMRALDVYLNLAELDVTPDWQLPVYYQVALVYERLNQPSMAIETYQKIIDHESELNQDSGPGTRATIDMSRWRRDFIGWKLEAEKSKVLLQRLPDVGQQPTNDEP